MGVRRWAIALVSVAVVAAGCTDADGNEASPADGSTTTTSALPAQPTDADLADAAGCTVLRDFGDDLPAVDPIRGGAAADGVACTLDGDVVHLFVRAPIDPDAPEGAPLDGSFENIDRLVATGSSPDCTTWVAVGETWFALTDDEDLLARVADDLGGTVREILPTGPPASYSPPGCP